MARGRVGGVYKKGGKKEHHKTAAMQREAANAALLNETSWTESFGSGAPCSFHNVSWASLSRARRYAPRHRGKRSHFQKKAQTSWRSSSPPAKPQEVVIPTTPVLRQTTALPVHQGLSHLVTALTFAFRSRREGGQGRHERGNSRQRNMEVFRLRKKARVWGDDAIVSIECVDDPFSLPTMYPGSTHLLERGRSPSWLLWHVVECEGYRVGPKRWNAHDATHAEKIISFRGRGGRLFEMLMIHGTTIFFFFQPLPISATLRYLPLQTK